MTIHQIFESVGVVIVSLGGAGVLITAFSGWLGKVWAERALQDERAKNENLLEQLKKELDLLKQKELTRHLDKLTVYREVIVLISEMLRELEAVAAGTQSEITAEVKRNFSLNRNKIYGYISLVSTQEVMDNYNEMIDFLLPVVYEEKKETWSDMRTKADILLNSMRLDLGIKEGGIIYRGKR